jgi:hypothetical protein
MRRNVVELARKCRRPQHPMLPTAGIATGCKLLRCMGLKLADDFTCRDAATCRELGPKRTWRHNDAARPLVELNWQSHGRFLMNLAATHEPPRDVGGLQRGALSG